MGLSFGTFELLKHQKRKILPAKDGGRKALMFGRAKMSLSDEQRALVSQRDGISLELLSGWADRFLIDYGYDWIGSLDYSSFEGAEFTWNLNKPLMGDVGALSVQLGSMDLVLDYGTSEHVFCPSTSLWNATKFLRLGGILNAVLPIAGWCDHGMYQFSPSFFYAIDRSDLRLESLYFYCADNQTTNLICWDGLSAEFRQHVHGAFDGSFAANCLQYLNKPILAFALFRKERDLEYSDFVYSTQQSIYAVQWEKSLKFVESDQEKLRLYNLREADHGRELARHVRSFSVQLS